MRETFGRVETQKAVPYPDQIAEDLDISQREVDGLTEMFQNYATERGSDLQDERSVVRTIRHFLHDRKPDIKTRFADSVLGQSGCFPFSVRSCLLASRFGIESSLARSDRTRALHVMLIDKEGNPYDIRELEKGKIKPMSHEQVRAYGRYLQPVVATVDAFRRRKPAPRHREHQQKSEIRIIPCNDEVNA